MGGSGRGPWEGVASVLMLKEGEQRWLVLGFYTFLQQMSHTHGLRSAYTGTKKCCMKNSDRHRALTL